MCTLQSLLLSVQIHYFTSDTVHQRGWVNFGGQETLQLWGHHAQKGNFFANTMKTAVFCPLKGMLVRPQNEVVAAAVQHKPLGMEVHGRLLVSISMHG